MLIFIGLLILLLTDQTFFKLFKTDTIVAKAPVLNLPAIRPVSAELWINKLSAPTAQGRSSSGRYSKWSRTTFNEWKKAIKLFRLHSFFSEVNRASILQKEQEHVRLVQVASTDMVRHEKNPLLDFRVGLGLVFKLSSSLENQGIH